MNKTLLLILILTINTFGQVKFYKSNPKPYVTFDYTNNQIYILDEVVENSIGITSGRNRFRVDTIAVSDTNNIMFESISDSIVYKDSTEYLLFTIRTDSLGSYSEMITLNNNKVVTVNWDVELPPQIIADQDSINYGTVTAYDYRTITFTNPTNQDLDIGNVLGDPTPFIIYFGGNAIVPANGTKTVDIIINPIEDSTYNINIGFRSTLDDITFFDTNWVNVRATVDIQNPVELIA